MENPPKIRAQPKPSCPLCGTAGRGLYDHLTDCLFGTAGEWGFSQCPRPDCGLLWLNPAPVAEDLHLAYQTYFTHADAPAGQAAPSRTGKFLSVVYNAAASLPRALLELRKEQRQRACMFLTDQSPGRLLDVGCGDGTFLHKMQARGWKVDGVDFDRRAIENARLRYNLELRHGDLASAGFPSSTFDAVTLNNVIEHVPDPVGLLAEAWHVLKSGGRLVVITPNASSLGHQVFKQAWLGLDPPRHLKVFSPEALRTCAERAGIHSPQVWTTAAHADRFAGGSFLITEVQRRCASPRSTPGVRIVRTVRSWALAYREQSALKRDGNLGEEAVLTGTKHTPTP
jgi:SAM-dependent methyltransferase